MTCNAEDSKSTGPVNIWEETLPVRFGAIDRSDRLTLDSVFQFFQEAAISHAENLGVGREELAQAKQAWILSRMSVLVDRRPVYRETVTVRSWPRGGEKLFALRDYDIRDSSDIPLVRARSGWLIIDMEKRRPLRPQSVMGILPVNDGLDALASGPVSLFARENLQKAGERKALYSDIDYNGHVNNVSYIKWIEDVLDPAIPEKSGRMRFDINYLNEVLSGEAVDLLTTAIDGSGETIAAGFGAPRAAFAVEGRNTLTGQAAFRAELKVWD